MMESIKIIKYGFFLIFLLSASLMPSFCQKPALSANARHKADSLNSILNFTTKDTVKINTLIAIADIYTNAIPDTAVLYYNKALLSAYTTNNQKYIARCLGALGNFFTHQGNYSEAIKYYNQSLKIYEKLSDKRGIAKYFSNAGNIYAHQGAFEKAVKHYLKSLKIYENLSDKDGISKCYNNIGIIYGQQGLYEKAIEYYTMSLKIAEEMNNKKGMAYCYNNIGNIYSMKENYYKAMEYYNKSLHAYTYLNDIRGISTNYSNIGCCKRFLGKYTDAINFYTKSLKISETLDDKEGMATVMLNIAALYTLTDKNETAIEYSNRSLKIAKEIGSLPLQKIVYQCLAEANENLKNYKSACYYYKLFNLTKDSVFNIEKNKQISDLQTKYETEKKEVQINSLRKDKELQSIQIARERLIRNLVLAGAGLLSIIVIIIFLYIRIWRVKERIESEKKIMELEQKSLLYQMNPHFIFNSLNSVSAQMINDVNSARDFLAKFSRLIRLILENSRSTYVPLQNEIDIISYYLMLEQQRLNNFEFKITVDKNIIPENVEIPPMFIQPHIENAIIHGIHKKEGNGLIDVRIIKINESTISCEIEDNGTGRKKTAETNISNNKQHKPLAMEITQERLKILSQENRRTFTFKIEDLEDRMHNPSGTKITITLPVKII